MVNTSTLSSNKSSSAARQGELDFFKSSTPLGFAGGDANLTRYVGNSPTQSTDPDGKQKVTVTATRAPALAGKFPRTPDLPIRINYNWTKKGQAEAITSSLKYSERYIKVCDPLLYSKQDNMWVTVLHEDVGNFINRWTSYVDQEGPGREVTYPTQSFCLLTELAAETILPGRTIFAENYAGKDTSIYGTKEFLEARKFYDDCKAGKVAPGTTFYATLQLSGNSNSWWHDLGWFLSAFNRNYVRGWWTLSCPAEGKVSGDFHFGLWRNRGNLRGAPGASIYRGSSQEPIWWPATTPATWKDYDYGGYFIVDPTTGAVLKASTPAPPPRKTRDPRGMIRGGPFFHYHEGDPA